MGCWCKGKGLTRSKYFKPQLPCADFKHFYINRFILSKWQMSWDRATVNKLHEIKQVLGKNTIYRSLRREEVVLTCLSIGHTRLTHSYLSNEKISHFVYSVMNLLWWSTFWSTALNSLMSDVSFSKQMTWDTYLKVDQLITHLCF